VRTKEEIYNSSENELFVLFRRMVIPIVEIMANSDDTTTITTAAANQIDDDVDFSLTLRTSCLTLFDKR
jgi:hypothetical protein